MKKRIKQLEERIERLEKALTAEEQEYYYLKKGDVIKEGDEYFDEGVWSLYFYSIGSNWSNNNYKSRRLITKQEPTQWEKLEQENEKLKSIIKDTENFFNNHLGFFVN